MQIRPNINLELLFPDEFVERAKRVEYEFLLDYITNEVLETIRTKLPTAIILDKSKLLEIEEDDEESYPLIDTDID